MNPEIRHFPTIDKLQPLAEFKAEDFQLLLDRARFRRLEPRTLLGRETQLLVYLLEGEVALLSQKTIREQFTHLQQRALQPLFNETLEEDSAILMSHGAILEIDRDLYEGLYSQQQFDSYEQSEVMLEGDENSVFQHLLKAFNDKSMELPALPEVAFKIRDAIRDPKVGTNEITQMVQSDPVLTARLIRVANSPLYGTWREIKTVRDAVRRLGLEATRNLALSLSVKQLFSARTALVKQAIKEVYENSVGVASLAYVIARHCAEVDPERAVLTALLQQIGVIPILKYLDDHPGVMQSAEQLQKSVENLLVPCSVMLFNSWEFDPEFILFVEKASDWDHHSDTPTDLLDVLIAARALYLWQHDQWPARRSLNALPVLEKLGFFNEFTDADTFLAQAERELSSIKLWFEP